MLSSPATEGCSLVARVQEANPRKVRNTLVLPLTSAIVGLHLAQNRGAISCLSSGSEALAPNLSQDIGSIFIPFHFYNMNDLNTYVCLMICWDILYLICIRARWGAIWK